MTDTELEDRVRTTLRAVAAADAAPVASRARRWPVIAAAAAVVIVVGAAIALQGDDTAQVHVTAPPSEVAASPLPTGFDVRTAGAVFTAEGTVDEVVDAYLASRFPDYPSPGVRSEPATVDGELATARWHTDITHGDVRLRLIGHSWSVVAATTDDVFLDQLVIDGDRVHGAVTTSDINSLFVDVLDPTGEPVPGAPRPEGYPGAEYRFGTGGGPADGELKIDVSMVGPAVMRVNLVGGTILSISEVRLDPPSTSTTVIGEGDGWDLVATDEETGHWVTLRAAQVEGVFRLETDGNFDSLFTVIGPCCRINGNVVVVGALRRDTTGMQVKLSDDRVIAAQSFADPVTGVQYAVALIPIADLPSDPTARVEIRLADGTFQGMEFTLDLSVIGG